MGTASFNIGDTVTMKLAPVLAAVIGVVCSEHCRRNDTTSCANTICIQDYVPTCLTGICTCNPKPTVAQSCSSLYDCEKLGYWLNHHCGYPQRECKNGDCVCN